MTHIISVTNLIQNSDSKINIVIVNGGHYFQCEAKKFLFNQEKEKRRLYLRST